jgi:glycosyltransferase involved in cell wall biosynthesis
MLTEALVVSLSRNFWDEVWRSRHQVMSRLARHNDVIFVSRPLSVDEALTPRAATPLVRRPGAHRVTDRLTAYVPPRYLPKLHRAEFASDVLDVLRRSHLRRFARRWRQRSRVLYLWHPGFAPYIDAFPDHVVCYHLFDDLADGPSARASKTEDALTNIFRRADLVFTASEELQQRYERFGNVYWVPNGVDYELYAGVPRTVAPADLASIAAPRVGYVGTLRHQIDLTLIADLAAAKPDWSFVLIGESSHAITETSEFEQLRARRNVHMLGAKPGDAVPAYLAHLDVGLLPYLLDGPARFCYPLKMHEYLAAGLPVVSSRISAVRPFASVISVAGSVDEWIREIERALGDRAESRVGERQRVARDNSWDQRVARISNLIAQRVAARA